MNHEGQALLCQAAAKANSMIIKDSNIQMTAARSYVEKHERRESLTIWRDGDEARQTNANDADSRAHLGLRALAFAQQQVRVSISKEAQAMLPAKAIAPDEEELEPMQDLEINLIKLLVEKLTGREIKLMKPSDFKAKPTDPADFANTPKHAEHQQAPAPEQRVGWGLVYDYYESHYEAESTSFSASGLIHTADGKEISFDVDMSMSREFMSQQSLNIRAGDALKDPLVINFSGRAAELSTNHFSFDLDVDGKQEQIAFVTPGSGFLALDKNADGIINSGAELFGPTSGDGFAELARYDEDGNAWIDEADAIYDRLRIWSKDSAGNDQLVALGEKGIGAIYLGHIDTPFLLKDEANQLTGAVRSSGLFVEEDGGVGTVQQVDLVV